MSTGGLNLTNKHLNDPLVREAIALAFDKGQIISLLYEQVFGAGVLDPDGLWNTYFMPNQSDYQRHGFDNTPERRLTPQRRRWRRPVTP